MGMMTKMRDNAHIFIIAFAVVFVAFWVISDVDISAVLRGSQNELAKIDGKTISYQEFQGLVDQMVEDRRKQNNNQELDDNTISSIREQVWSDYLTRAVIDRAVKDLKITVNDQEITDWVRSDNPPEALTKFFKDSTGKFNRDAYLQFLNNPGAENQQALIQIEKQLKDDLIRQKLTSILSSAVIYSEQNVKDKFIDQNTQISANYIVFDPRVFAAKDTAAPTDEEYRAWYDKNKKMFKTKEMRKLKYVLFPEVPSSSDTAAVRNELLSILEEANKGQDFLELLKNSSEQPYQDQWISRQSMNPELAAKIFGNPVGSVLGPFSNETGMSLYKIIDERTGTDVLTQASHILFRTDGGQNEAEQKKKAEEAYRRAKSGENFGDLAAQLSEEPGAQQSKGALGWFGKGRMVKEFEDAALKAKVGDIVGPIKTQFGWHVIKVTGRSSQELKLAEIRMTIRASASTRDAIYEKARNFAYFAHESNLEQEAKQANVRIDETPEFAQQSGSYIPNIGVSPALMKFSFNNKVGTISEVARAANGYVVAMVSAERPAGYKPLDEVRDQIKPQVVMDRQMRKTLEYARSIATPGKSLQDIAAANPSLTIQPTNTFTPQAGAPGVGRDEAFIGRMLSTPQGKITEPFRGMRGIFVAQVISKTPFDETSFKIKRTDIRTQNLQSLQNEFIQNWLEEMKDKLSITDNRDRFYR